MSLNPLNELKRRLVDDITPLSKRLCLAKNLVQSHHFPAGPKERIISEWINKLSNENNITRIELEDILDWLNNVDDMTSELKSRIIQIVSKYVKQNVLENMDIDIIVTFLENTKVSSQLNQHINEYLIINSTLLQHLRTGESNEQTKRIFNNYIKYYKDSKKKLEFIIKLLNGEHLETLFSYLDTDSRDTVIKVCKNILFPITKKTFFISYLQTLIRKDNLDELLQEKGDNIQSVIKIMSIFFEFPKNRTDDNPKFLSDFIDVFVSCFKSENQIVFAFYIMVANVLRMKQDYITASMDMKPIIFKENGGKIIRNIFLKMLVIILHNDIDVTVRLTDTFGEKISKVEIKKNFLSFLQNIMIGQLKVKGKTDRTSLLIIITALKLDPSLIENKMEDFLPPLMVIKKSSVKDTYIEMMNCLLETLFKLSRGTLFINQILPFVRINLEVGNTEQFELRTKLKEFTINGDVDCEKLKNKIVFGNDVFPDECVDVYGKLTTELMFRQNRELLESLQKDFIENCLVLLEDGNTDPSVLIVTEFMAAILCSFFNYSKMADHTVPQHIAEEFWNLFENFQNCLKRLGKCVLKFNEPSLLKSFLKLSQSYCRLKLLNMKYSNYKLKLSQCDETSNVFDMSVLLPCLSSERWIAIAGKVSTDDEVILADNLIQLKTIALKLISIENPSLQTNQTESNTYLIKQFNNNPNQVTNIETFDLNKQQCKQLSKSIVKYYLNEVPTLDVTSINNKNLLNSLVMEILKNITKFTNCDSLTKQLNKIDFDVISFSKNVDFKTYFNDINLTEENDNLKKCLEVLKLTKLPYLEENVQLSAMLVLLLLKKCCQSKKIKKSIDYIFLNIFELSQHPPDIFQLFSVDFIFDFKNKVLVDLLTIKIRNCNHFFLIKSLIKSATKRLRTGNQLIVQIVEILLKSKPKTGNTIQVFSDTAFQITCLVLPTIVKQRQLVTTSAPRLILADLEKKLGILLETFEIGDFKNGSICNKTGNTDDSFVENNEDMATLNAISVYALTLSRYCENHNGEFKGLDCLSGLKFFVETGIKTIKLPTSKSNHIESSLQLLNISLRHIKELQTHEVFNKKDELLIEIWQSVLIRLKFVFQNGDVLKCGYLSEINVLLKFLCELCTVECFVAKFIPDLDNLIVFKHPNQIIKDESKSDLMNHKISKYLWSVFLKSNIAGPKCGSLTKIIYQKCKNLKSWLRQHYDSVTNMRKRKLNDSDVIIKIDDGICELIKINLDVLSDVIFAGKKITIDYKFLDAIFELQHIVHCIMNFNTNSVKYELSWQSFFSLYEGSVAILNSLLVSRKELLEDRWPCYMQCYRALVSILCNKSTSEVTLERDIDEKFAQIAHNVEKLTQSISKLKKQVSRISAYTVADICTYLERKPPSKMVRQHLENSVAMLIQASDSSYAMAFLKRALAGSIGQMTLNNLYINYKRYHKYVGNS